MEIAHLWRAKERKGVGRDEESGGGFLSLLAGYARLVKTMPRSWLQSVKENVRYWGIRFLELVQGAGP